MELLPLVQDGLFLKRSEQPGPEIVMTFDLPQPLL